MTQLMVSADGHPPQLSSAYVRSWSCSVVPVDELVFDATQHLFPKLCCLVSVECRSEPASPGAVNWLLTGPRKIAGPMVDVMLLLPRVVIVDWITLNLETSRLLFPAFTELLAGGRDDKISNRLDKLDRQVSNVAIRTSTKPVAEAQCIDSRKSLDMGFEMSTKSLDTHWECPLRQISWRSHGPG